MIDASDSTSTRPYLIRALYEWCTDNGYTPYVAVLVDGTVQVPVEYVKGGEIVLNISFDATSSLKLGNEFIEFKARFAGLAREIMVPVNRVIAIYARENGQGMAFPMSVPQGPGKPEAGAVPLSGDASPREVSDSRALQLTSVESAPVTGSSAPPQNDPPRPPAGPRPSLKRVK